jgi:putative hydrolase of the HAD superfamily
LPDIAPNFTAVKPSHTPLLGAIFDCDGLLADTETPDYDAWREIYEEQGLHLPVELWAQSIGTAKGHDLRDWHAPLAEAIGRDYDPDAIQARRQAFYHAAIGKLTPMPGVLAVLDAFDEAQIPCAVASNSDRVWVDRILDIIGLTSRFRVIATADEVEHPKPAPDVYLLAAKRLGVPPQSCAAFEDSPRGLAAAHAAGMFTVAVPTALTRHFAFEQAHHMIDSLERLALKDLIL